MSTIAKLPEDQIPVDPKRLFVYGSLMEGFSNYKEILKEGRVISRISGRVRGTLYHQEKKDYPAMIPSDGWVGGEFLKLENFDKQISSCDKVEDYFGPNHQNNYYERRITEVELENGKTDLAWVYWYVRDDLGSEQNPVIPVPSGNWREFKETQGRR